MEILRPSSIIYHVISTISGIPGVPASFTHSGGVALISVYNLDGNRIIGSELTPRNAASPTEETFDLAPNSNYIAAFTITEGTTADYSYQSFETDCLFHSSYSDLRGVFTPCTSTTAPTGFPSLTAPSIPVFGDTILQTDD